MFCISQMVKTALTDLRTLLTLKFKVFIDKNGSYYRKFDEFCADTKQSLSIDTPDKVTNFFEWLIEKAAPKKANRIAAHTAINHLSQVCRIGDFISLIYTFERLKRPYV